MSDVERVADALLLMNERELIEFTELDRLRARFRRVSFVFDDLSAQDMEIPGGRNLVKGVREWSAVFDGKTSAEIAEIAISIGARDSAETPLTLEEVSLEKLGRTEAEGGEQE